MFPEGAWRQADRRAPLPLNERQLGRFHVAKLPHFHDHVCLLTLGDVHLVEDRVRQLCNEVGPPYEGRGIKSLRAVARNNFSVFVKYHQLKPQ